MKIGTGLGLILLCGLVTGCPSTPNEGEFPCTRDEECPSGWFCRDDLRCWSSPDPVDAGGDAGVDAAMSRMDVPDGDTPLGMDVPEGVDAPLGMDVPEGADAPLGMDVPEGVDAPLGTDAPLGMDAGIDAPIGVDAPTDSGVDAPQDAGGPCSGLPFMTFYRDMDGDGHGAASSGTMMRCGPGGGFVASNDDCDDGNVSRFPGNPELCNSIDDDCNGTVDGPAASSSCGLANAVSACVGGFCEVGSCNVDFGNCDGIDTNGCEVDTRISASHCGSCGSSCGAALSCAASTCEVSPVVQAALNRYSGCARRANGRIACWGDNTWGELGVLDPLAEPGPVAVTGIDDAVDLSGSVASMCAVRSSGEVWCWGLNREGQLGRPPTSEAPNLPAPVPGVVDAVEVQMGLHNACARRASGRVVCWGNRGPGGGYLGDGVAGGGIVTTPVAVSGLTDAIALGSQPDSGFCAVRATGAVVCWGPAFGSAPATPTAMSAVTTASGVAVAFPGNVCALTTGGGLVCGPSLAPMGGVSGAAEVVDQADDFFCFRSTGGGVSCWGSNPNGELGRGTTGGAFLAPAPVIGLADAVDITAYYHSACSVTAGGVRCWGANDQGQLGDGTTSARSTPVAVLGL